MAKKDLYEERAEALLEPIAAANGCEVYDVEYVKEGAAGICGHLLTRRTVLISLTAKM